MKIEQIKEFANEAIEEIEQAEKWNEKNKNKWEKEHGEFSFVHAGVGNGLYKAKILLYDTLCEWEGKGK